MAEAARQTRLSVEGMCCPGCARTIESAVRAVDGIAAAEVNYQAAVLTVGMVGASIDQIVSAVEEVGYRAIPDGGPKAAPAQGGWLAYLRANRRAQMALASALLFAVGLLAGLIGQEAVARLFYAAAIPTGGWYALRAGWSAIRTGFFNIDVLMVVAAIGACSIGEWQEGAAVVVLFATGGLLEAYTAQKARGSIRSLIDLAPPTANLVEGGAVRTVPARTVAAGDLIRINPGDRVPLDGTVVSGASAVNQAPITGESVPAEKEPGSPVYAGSVNGSGGLDIRVTAPAGQTTLDRIVSLVEQAQARRAPTERMIDRFARWYTPLILALALVTGVVIPLLFRLDFATWFYRGLGLLIVACPCALVISTPVSIVAGLGRAARSGALIKGGAHLERAGNIAVVALDKTGTVTWGRPAVAEVLPIDPHLGRNGLLGLAAAVDSGSSHPLGQAIVRAAPGHPPASAFEALPGLGASALVAGARYFVGSPRLFAEQLGLQVPDQAERWQAEGLTAVLVGTEQRLVGLIGMVDELRPGAREAVAALKESRRVVLLSGDSQGAAEAAGRALGIQARGGMLPEEKLRAVQALRVEGPVLMVGDGINDAPALAVADLSAAMGAAGAGVALESADIALMGDDLSRLPYVLDLGRRTLATIRANVAFAIGIKLLAVALVLPGVMGLWAAVLADTGAAVLVTLNSMRLLYDRG